MSANQLSTSTNCTAAGFAEPAEAVVGAEQLEDGAFR